MKTLLFDLDDTLIVEEASAKAAFHATCEYAKEKCGIDPEQLYTNIRESCRSSWYKAPAREYCLNIGISSWEGLWAQFLGHDKHVLTLAKWATTYRLNSWGEAISRCGHKADKTLAKELSEKFIEERQNRHVVYEDVLPALEHFRKKYRLGLITNGAPDLQRTKLNASGLEEFFDSVIISGEVGFGKPGHRIFELALKTLGAEADSTAMIGNSLRLDISPALELNMTAVWMNRESKQLDDAIIPQATVSNLTELMKIFQAPEY